jgi:hypothetical protein
MAVACCLEHWVQASLRSVRDTGNQSHAVSVGLHVQVIRVHVATWTHRAEVEGQAPGQARIHHFSEPQAACRHQHAWVTRACAPPGYVRSVTDQGCCDGSCRGLVATGQGIQEGGVRLQLPLSACSSAVQRERGEGMGRCWE